MQPYLRHPDRTATYPLTVRVSFRIRSRTRTKRFPSFTFSQRATVYLHNALSTCDLFSRDQTHYSHVESCQSKCELIFQILARTSSAQNRKIVSWTIRGSRHAVAGNNAASNTRRFAEATAKRIRTSACCGRRPANHDYR